MLEVGSFRARDCAGITRRAFLHAGAALPFAAATPLAGLAADSNSAPKAKSVMLIWLGGGPSHLDLFDPKPKATDQYRGPFGAIKTKTSGLLVTELLPKLAQRSDRYSVIRTNINYQGGHRPAGSIAMTGTKPTDGGEDRGGKAGGYGPHVGAIVARKRGGMSLPGFVSLATGPIGDGVGPNVGQGGGKWGKGHDPFMLSCSDDGKVAIPRLKLLDGLSPARLSDRKTVLRELDRLRRRADSSALQKWDGVHAQAMKLLGSRDAIKLFDLSREPETTRQAFGHTAFGQSCLLGRRLVEAGVPFVQVNWSRFVEVLFPFSDYGWDTHSDNFGLMADWHGPLLDRTLSALLDDLHERGLLKTTLVLCMGEFGRTPKINNIASRDHWPSCYFSVWAGGGIQPGRVIGQSDPRGEHPATDPTTPEMVGTTVLELAGVDTVTRAKYRVLEGGRPIDGLL
ncbi:MAG: DUF1501 domain-containing protein [Planctomycetaceae bacterium]